MENPVIYGNQEVRARLEEICKGCNLDFVYTAQRKKNILGDKAIIIGGKENQFYKITCNYKTKEVLKEKKIKLKEVDTHAKAYFNKNMPQYGF